MSSTWRGRMRTLLTATACALAVVVVCGVLEADDVEYPADPLSGDGVTVPLGDLTVEADDVGGSAIDAKDTLEPQLTAMMLTTDVSVSPGQTLGIQTSPTVETWTQ